jgi:peroxiredoxin
MIDEVSLSSFSGGAVVVYFYPKAGHTGCKRWHEQLTWGRLVKAAGRPRRMM